MLFKVKSSVDVQLATADGEFDDVNLGGCLCVHVQLLLSVVTLVTRGRLDRREMTLM